MNIEDRKVDFEISHDEGAGTVDIDFFHPIQKRSRQYCLDVTLMFNSAAILDMVVQVANKPWATNELVGTLIKFLDHLLHLQGNYCGGSVDGGHKNPESIYSLIIEERVRREYAEEREKQKPAPEDGCLPMLNLFDVIGDPKELKKRQDKAKSRSKWITNVPGDAR